MDGCAARERRLRLTVSSTVKGENTNLVLGAFGYLGRDEGVRQGTKASAVVKDKESAGAGAGCGWLVLIVRVVVIVIDQGRSS